METGQDLRDAAVRHLQLAAYVAGPHAQLGPLDDLPPDAVGQRAPIDEVAAQLVGLAIGLLLLLLLDLVLLVDLFLLLSVDLF